MANWYNDIEIKTKKNIKIKSIIDWLEEEYEIDDEAISVEEKNNKLLIKGDEGWTISLKEKNRIPLCEELFTNLSKKFFDSEYEAYASLENSYSSVANEFFIKYCDKKLIIEVLDNCSKVDLYEYDDYEEFNDNYSCNLDEEKFKKYKDNEELLYINESGKVYTEEQYYNSKKEYFSINIDDVSCQDKEDIINKINEKSVDTIFNSLSKSQKEDRDIILKVIKTDVSYIDEIDDKFFKDKEIIYTILKECVWFWDKLISYNENIEKDVMLVSIYKKLQQIQDDEQDEYGELFKLKLSKEQSDQKQKEIEEKYSKLSEDYINNLEKSDDFIKWIHEKI